MDIQCVCFILCGVCYTRVHCWSCLQDITREYARPGSRAVISFQTSIQSSTGLSEYTVVANNGSIFYASTFYKGVFQNAKEHLNSTFIGEVATGNFTIQTNNIHSTDAGIYRLQYSEGDDTSTLKCSTLYILGIPTQPNIQASNDPSVGDDATLTCECTSTTVPRNHSLSRSYNWNVDNSAVTSSGKYSLSGNTLVVSNVAKIDKDLKFTCTSTEVVTNGYTSDSSGEYSINVVYCGNPGIANAQFTGNTQFGDTVTFTCNTNYTLTGSENATCESTGSWTTLPTCTVTLKRGLPLPYGAAQGDRNVTGTDDTCAVQINTDCYIPFKGNQFKTIFICPNGLVCFGTKYQSYSIPRNGEDVSNTTNCLAPYFADIDLRQTGIIWYQTYNLSDISLVDTTVNELITGTYGVDFNPVYMLKATWEDAPQYNRNINNTVTFQIIYVTDGLTAYTHFHYEEDGMNFPFGPQYIGLMYDGLAYGIDDNENGTYLARPDLHFVSGNYAGATSFNLLGGTSSSNCFSGASVSVSSSIMSPTSSSSASVSDSSFSMSPSSSSSTYVSDSSSSMSPSSSSSTSVTVSSSSISPSRSSSVYASDTSSRMSPSSSISASVSDTSSSMSPSLSISASVWNSSNSMSPSTSSSATVSESSSSVSLSYSTSNSSETPTLSTTISETSISVTASTAFSSTTSSSMMSSSTSAFSACASFSGPGNGAVNFQCFTEGCTAQFSCNAGYTLTGNSSTTCQNQAWDREYPTCVQIALKRGLPLPYGAVQGDRIMTGTDDACAVQINTDCYIPFKGNQFKTIFICTNGLVCFGTKYQSYSIPRKGEDVSNTANCLAPYFADIDLRQTGIIWYQTYKLSDISIVDTTVNELITGTYGVDFNPVYMLKATWDGAPQYGANINNFQTVTFQIIYVTDGLTAYTHFHYEEDGMNFPFGPQYIGLMYDGLAHGFDDNENGTYLARPDLHFVSGNYAGATSFNLQGGTSSSNCFTCAHWATVERPNRGSYRRSLARMPRCPCNPFFLNFDQRFAYYYPHSITNATTGILSVPVLPNAFYQPHGKTCIYQYGSFVRSAGHFDYYNSISHPTENALYDTNYRTVCCSGTDNMCDLYHDVRPAHTCNRFFWVFFAFGFGDPHITTLDGRAYTFNGHGEYVLVRIPTVGFQVQCRTERATSSTGSESQATIFTAFALQSDTTWIQVEISDNGNGINVFVGTSKTSWADYTLQYMERESIFYLTETLTLSRDGNTLVTMFTTEGVMFNVTVGFELLQMNIGVNSIYHGLTEGLLGNFDSNKTDDLRPQQSLSTPLPNSANDSEIFHDFGQTWITSQSESIFKYDNGKSHDDYIHRGFVPVFLDELDDTVVLNATNLCGAGNLTCIFDYALTGNADLALNTKETEERAAIISADISNIAPTISVGNGVTVLNDVNYLYVTINTDATFTLLGTDDGTMTYQLRNTTANISVGTPRPDGTIDFTVTVTDTDPVSLSVTAIDNHGVFAPVINVVIVLCTECSTHGSCSYTIFRNDVRSTDTFKYGTCSCEPYWTGDDCELDRDGCETDTCSFHHERTCDDTSADAHRLNPSLPAYTCSPCPDGYQNILGKCEDVNECNSSACDQGCVNTQGGYYCTCNSGYRLSDGGANCTDINECDESTAGCHQICTNNDGGFECSCNVGFTYDVGSSLCVKVGHLRSDLLTGCNATDCSNADGCTHNATGYPVCFCIVGYELLANNTCSNINECDAATICTQVCTDTEGSFTCSCHTGYRLLEDKTTCEACRFPTYGENCASVCVYGRGTLACDPVSGCIANAGWTGSLCDTDIDECLVPNVCGADNPVCTNTLGSYTCSCNPGYELVDGTCSDIDECADMDLNICSDICTNTLGGFSCSCGDGSNVDPKDANKCIVFDKCAAKVSGCEQMCIYAEGKSSCECFFGYILNDDRLTCTKVSDPCALFPDTNCTDICLVVDEAAVCSCSAGYLLGTDNQTCLDINECDINLALNMCSDNSTCVNSAGGYVCRCDTGFKLENDGRTCKECDAFHFGENCATECNCTPGATRCDSLTGCVCEPGWTGDKCGIDKNECNNFPCTGDHIECINTPGSYVCACITGYAVDGNGTCQEVDECSSMSLHDCSQICTNTVGGYQCSCHSGFLQNGTACNDINECEGQNECDHTCSNTVGAYRCLCDAGFKLNIIDKTTCIPSETCEASTNPCGANTDCAVIDNTEECFCHSGYQFESGSSTTCEDETPFPLAAVAGGTSSAVFVLVIVVVVVVLYKRRYKHKDRNPSKSANSQGNTTTHQSAMSDVRVESGTVQEEDRHDFSTYEALDASNEASSTHSSLTPAVDKPSYNVTYENLQLHKVSS